MFAVNLSPISWVSELKLVLLQGLDKKGVLVLARLASRGTGVPLLFP